MKRKLHGYVLDHDNRWSFILAYITLAVVLAIAINLFYLTLVVAIHGLFEWVKQRRLVDDRIGQFSRVLWELKLDVGLVFFGLSMEVYMEYALGLVGLGAAARAGAAGGRFVVLQNVLRATLLSVDDAAQVGRMVAAKRSGEEEDGTDGALLIDPDEEALREARAIANKNGRLGPWIGRYSLGDKISLGFGALCLALILVAPAITPHDFASVWQAIAEEMHPWPWGGE